MSSYLRDTRLAIPVKDANVLIDLIEVDLLGLWFRLGIETHTTDLVIHEIRQPEQSRVISMMVAAGNLTVHSLDSKRLRAAHSGLPDTDWEVRLQRWSAI